MATDSTTLLDGMNIVQYIHFISSLVVMYLVGAR